MGVPIRLHFTFVLLLIFLIVIGLGGNQSPGSYTLLRLGLDRDPFCCMNSATPWSARTTASGRSRS